MPSKSARSYAVRATCRTHRPSRGTCVNTIDTVYADLKHLFLLSIRFAFENHLPMESAERAALDTLREAAQHMVSGTDGRSARAIVLDTVRRRLFLQSVAGAIENK